MSVRENERAIIENAYEQHLVPSEPPKVRTDKTVIEGELPSPIHMPEGCRFHPRCPYCQEKCRKEKPELKEMGNGRKVACHYPLAGTEEDK